MKRLYIFVCSVHWSFQINLKTFRGVISRLHGKNLLAFVKKKKREYVWLWQSVSQIATLFYTSICTETALLSTSLSLAILCNNCSHSQVPEKSFLMPSLEKCCLKLDHLFYYWVWRTFVYFGMTPFVTCELCEYFYTCGPILLFCFQWLSGYFCWMRRSSAALRGRLTAPRRVSDCPSQPPFLPTSCSLSGNPMAFWTLHIRTLAPLKLLIFK